MHQKDGGPKNLVTWKRCANIPEYKRKKGYFLPVPWLNFPIFSNFTRHIILFYLFFLRMKNFAEHRKRWDIFNIQSCYKESVYLDQWNENCVTSIPHEYFFQFVYSASLQQRCCLWHFLVSQQRWPRFSQHLSVLSLFLLVDHHFPEKVS